MRNRYNKGLIQVGGAVSFDITAPWVGHNHTINIKIVGALTQAGLLQVIKSSIADFIVFEEDPWTCGDGEFTFTVQVALRAGDKMGVEYDNPDDATIVIDATLESA